MVKGGFPDSAGASGQREAIPENIFLRALNQSENCLYHLLQHDIQAVKGYTLLPCNCSGWVPTCIGVARCGGLIVSLAARTSPITHFKAAIDRAVFCIYLATSPLGMVNLLLFVLGTAPHHCCCRSP